MSKVTRFLGLSVILGITMTLLPLATATASDSGCWTTRPAERGFAQKINQARNTTGRSHLRLDPELSRAARKHTFEMVRKDLLHHTSESALRRRVTNWSTLGENVGVGGTVESLHAAFMASPAHKDNILYSSFRHVGIGTVQRNGRMWVTVIFEAQTNPGTTLNMPNC
jgi:uncharacterized protein YkwD